MVKIEGLTLTGELIYKLEDKGFKIEGIPHYIEKEFDGKKQKKLVMSVKLMQSEAVYDYYPNPTSIKALVAQLGEETENWEGKIAEFEVKEQKIRGQDKKVIYVK